MRKLLILSSLILLSGLGKSYAQSAYDYIQLADTLLWDDAYEEVLANLQKADSLLDGNPDPENRLYYQIILGDYYLDMQQYPAAAEAYEPLLVADVPANDKMKSKLAKAVNDLGIAYYHLGEMEKAKVMHKQSLKLYDGNLQGLSYNYNNLAIIAKQLKELDSALYFFGKSLQAAEDMPDSIGMAYMYLNIGALHAERGHDIQALESLLQSRRIGEALKNNQFIAQNNIRLGVIYKRLRDFTSAMEFFKEAENFMINEEKPRTLGSIYKHMGSLHFELHAYDSAKTYTLMALDQYKPTKSVQGIADSYRLLGTIYKAQDILDTSEKYLDSALSMATGKYRITEITSTLSLADLRLKQKRYDEAIRLAEKIDESEDLGLPSGSRYLQARIFYKAYKAKGDFGKALIYQEQATEIKDSVYSQERAIEMARREFQDKALKQETLQKSEQERQDLLYRQERARNRWYLYSALGALLLLGLLAYSFYRNSRRKKQDNQLLSEQNETIAAYNNKLVAMNDSIATKNKALQTMNDEVAVKNQELQQKNNELSELREREMQHQQYEKELMEESMAVKEREMAATAMITHEKNAILSILEKRLAELQAKAGELKPEVEELRKTVLTNLNMKDSWDSFVHQFENVHPGFFSKLKTAHPDLTLNDLKMSAYIKVGMGNKEIAQVTNLALSTVKKNINRLKKKLGLAPEDSVRDYLIFKT